MRMLTLSTSTSTPSHGPRVKRRRLRFEMNSKQSNPLPDMREEETYCLCSADLLLGKGPDL